MSRGTVLIAASVTLALAGCAPGTHAPGRITSAEGAARSTAIATTTAGAPVRMAPTGVAGEPSAALPSAIVHKSPSCGCCAVWVKHLREGGFEVSVNNTDNLEPIKKRLGVPLGKGSCHTAQIGSLVIEGHVPIADIKRALVLKDGTTGMETPDGRVQRYTVEKINADGTTSPFAVHGG